MHVESSAEDLERFVVSALLMSKSPKVMHGVEMTWLDLQDCGVMARGALEFALQVQLQGLIELSRQVDRRILEWRSAILHASDPKQSERSAKRSIRDAATPGRREPAPRGQPRARMSGPGKAAEDARLVRARPAKSHCGGAGSVETETAFNRHTLWTS